MSYIPSKVQSLVAILILRHLTLLHTRLK